MTLIFNEGKACDAVIRVLEAREGEMRKDVRFPERERHTAPIELTCRIGGQLFALEHTGIEPFVGHMQMEAEAERLFKPVEKMLAGKLPAGDTFELSIPINALQSLSRNELARIQHALASWVEVTAPSIPKAPFGRYLKAIQKTKPPGVPFEVRLDRFETVVPPGWFAIKHLVTDAERLREARIREACKRKLPKLDAWNRNDNARTILVLEDNDIQLTNPQRVFETLDALKSDFTNWPDEIYLVSTITETYWYVHALLVDCRGYYELSEAGECMTEFDVDSLVNVTGR